MLLIVNADDFGLSEAVNHGIVKAFTDGAVRSTTLMANMEAVGHALELSKAHPGLGVGIHQTLTAGRPVTAAKTLTDESGVFWKQLEFFKRLESGAIDLNEVETEWHAQIDKARSMGFNITHLDSHHHVHLRPELIALSFRIAADYKLPVRVGKDAAHGAKIRTTGLFSMDFYGASRTAQNVIDIISPYAGQDVSFELMCHPAYVDKTLADATSYSTARIDELAALTSVVLKNFIAKSGITLGNFTALSG